MSDHSDLHDEQQTRDIHVSEQTNNYGQDLTQLLDQLFFGGYYQEIPDEPTVKNITKTIPLDNDYGQKYVHEISEFYEIYQAEMAEFSELEDYLARVYYKHELGTQLRSNVGVASSSASTEGLTNPESLANVVEDGVADETSDIDDNASCIKQYYITEECPEDVYGMESPIFVNKSDLRSIATTPTEKERLLLEKYGVLFAEPLVKKECATRFPANCGADTKRLSASGNDMRATKTNGKNKCHNEELKLCEIKKKCVFKAIPCEVIFTDCKPGKVYQTTLELKNTTLTAQQCNVLPPESGCFMIGEGKYPTENKNFVAPGLSCKYVIKFRPKLFKVYEDRIRVNVSNGKPFEVKLFGRRADPILNLKSKWNCGDCFCGNEVEMEFSITNSGGGGSFWLYKGSMEKNDVKNMFATDNQLNTYTGSWTAMKDFTISPINFDLKPKEEKTFTVTFKPTSPGTVGECLSIICDNHTCVSKFLIVGRSISVNRNLVALKCRWNFVRPQETWDVYAEHFLNFETIYLGNVASLSFTMINNSFISLKYHWDTFHPLFDPNKTTRVAVKEPTLDIFPLKGELLGQNEQLVKLTYKPEEESSLHIIVQLVVEDIPRAALDKTIVISEPAGDANAANVLLNFVDVQGKCIEYNLAIFPPQLLIHGALEIGTTHRQLIQLINHKRVPAYFKWSRCNYPNIVEVEPLVGFIGATYEMTLEVKITGTRVGEFVETLACEIQGVKQLLTLQVAFRICGHKVLIQTGNVNLGLIRAGCRVESWLELRNTVPFRVPWRLSDCTSQPFCNQSEIVHLELDPTSGEIEPLVTQRVAIVFHSQYPTSIRNTLQLEVDGAVQGCVGVTGEVISPNVCLQKCTYFAGTVYRSVPFSTSITLVNNSALDTTFCWDEAEGVDAKSCTIHFEPTKGSIGAFQSKAICVTCIVNHMISFHDVCVPCWVDGMVEPIYWSVSGEVNGIEIFCSLDNDSRRYCATLKEGGCEVEPHFDVDFGDQIPIGATVVREFRLTNNSAIMASFKITGDNFIATDLDEWQKAMDSNSQLPDYSNKKMQETLEHFLKLTNSGLAFIVYPPMGWIAGFKTANIQVIGLSDMWGFYKDMITVQVSEVKPMHMKVNFNSVGMTLKFLAAPLNDSVFKLRFGNHLIGGKKHTRGIKVINSGPCDLTIGFKSFVDLQTTTKPKLVSVQMHKTGTMPSAHTKSCDRCKTSIIKSILSDTDPIREKLVELNLLPYYGEINEEIFRLSPNPLLIRARSEAIFTVVFTPPHEASPSVSWKSGMPVICSHCTGLVTLDRNALSIKNKVSRQHGRKVANMDFKITVSLTMPKLTLVPDGEDEGSLFRLNGGNFLFGKPETMFKMRTLSFRNDCAARLHAVFETVKPFSIISCTKSVQRTRTLAIEPGDVIELNLQFTLKRYEVDRICRTSPCHTYEPETCPFDCMCRFCKDDKPHQLFFETPLRVQILESSKEEEIPLVGKVLLPYLTLASSELDFGICFVGQVSCQGVGILNSTVCDSSFCLVYESNCNEFRVEPIEGNVPGCHLENLPGRTELDIFFSPGHSVEYIQSVTIHGAFQLAPLRLVLKGIGSYDKKYERGYDVVDST